jgi:hypothetical protein
MVWAILAAVGVPLWLCATGILTLLCVHDVFGFRGSPAAWKEALLWVEDAVVRPASQEERKHLHRLGDEPVVVTLRLADGKTIALASRPEHRQLALGPFTAVAR